MDSEVMCDPIPESPRHRGSQKKGSVSPTRYSRLNEKKDLANLNDRLACYIDRVRSLESENRILLAEVSSIEEKHVREVSSLKDLYERELCDTRKLVDELSREKAKLEIDSRRLFSDLQQCKSDFDKKVEEANTLHSSVTLHEQRLAEANKLCNLLQSENRKLSDENKALQEEKARLLGQLNDARRVLEEETLCRVELENALQTAREEFTFNEQLYEQKLMETKKKVEVELTQFDGKLNEEYEERLYHNLQEIREQYELDLENNKEDIKKMYEEKLIGLNNQLTRANNVSTMAMDEIKNMQAKIDVLNMKIVSVEKDRNAAVKKTNVLEKELEVARNKYMEEYRIQQDELNKLREEMVHQLQEYQGLMDIKTALDLEIAAYRKLLEGEEARLNITPHSTPGGTRKILKGKRKHASSFEQTEEMFSKDYSFNSNSKCEVYISEISGEGQFIKLENKSDTDIPIGRWQLCQKTVADDIIFEFNAKMTIKPYGSITVWSEGIGPIPANDPNSLVMKGKKWVKADKMRVTLINQDDEEMASADNTKLNKSIKVLSRHSDRSYYGSSMQSDSNTSFNGEERCSIM